MGKVAETAYRDLLTFLRECTINIDETCWELLLHFLTRYRAVVDHSYFSTTGGRFGIATLGLQLGEKVCTLYGGVPLYILLRYPEGSLTSEPDYSTDHAQFCGTASVPYLMKQRQRVAARLGPDEIFVIV